MVVTLLQTADKLYQVARNKPVITLSVTISFIVAVSVATISATSDDMVDTFTAFSNTLFSEQYTERASAEIDEEMNQALVDAVGEKLTVHAVAE